MSEEMAKAPSNTSLFSATEQYYTSLDKNNPTHKLIIMRCVGDCDHRVKDCINMELPITDVFAHRVELTNEQTGQVQTAPRCVLITYHGETVECVSEGVYRDLCMLMWLYGKPPWKPPLLVTPKLVQLDGGRNLLKLKLIDPDNEVVKASKKK